MANLYDVQMNQLLQGKGESQNITIQSDVLDPATITDNYAIFKLRNAGIIDKNSRLVFNLYASNATTQLTLMGGAYSVIQNAYLRTHSGVQIAGTEDVNYLMSMRNNFTEQCIREKRNIVVNGTANNYFYNNDVLDGGHNTRKNGVIGYASEPDFTNIDDRFKLGHGEANQNEFSIKLSELFPEMGLMTLPTFLLNDSIELVLEFSDRATTGNRGVASDANNGHIGEVVLNKDSVKFVSDHLFFDYEIMNKIRAMSQTSQGIPIFYGDFNTVKNTLVAPAEPAAGGQDIVRYRRNIGMSDNRLRYMLFHNQMGSIGSHPAHEAHKICGKFSSQAPVVGEELQIIINNQNYFSQPIKDASQFYTQLKDVYGVDMYVPQSAYSCDGQSHDAQSRAQTNNTSAVNDIDTKVAGWTNKGFMATSQLALAGSNHIFGVNFSYSKSNTPNAGLKIGQNPVEIDYSYGYTHARTHSILQRIFVCLERVAVIKNGEIECNYA